MTQRYDVGTIPEWTVGDRLRKAREYAGLSQARLAARIGISRRSVSTYEAVGTAKRPVLLAWAVATEVRLGWLAGDDDRGPGPELPRVDSNHEPAGNGRTLTQVA